MPRSSLLAERSAPVRITVQPIRNGAWKRRTSGKECAHPGDDELRPDDHGARSGDRQGSRTLRE
jgi:hypothetical protein